MLTRQSEIVDLLGQGRSVPTQVHSEARQLKSLELRRSKNDIALWQESMQVCEFTVKIGFDSWKHIQYERDRFLKKYH